MKLTSDFEKPNKISASSVRPESACTRVIVHSTNTREAYYLFTLFDSAVSLLGREPVLQEIEIILHPLGVFHTPQTFFKGLKRWLYRSPSLILGELKSRLGRVKQTQPYVINSRTGAKGDFGAETNSIFAQVNQGRYPVVLATEFGTITVRRSGRQLIRSMREGVRTYFTARRLWRACHENGVLHSQRLLQLDYCGVVIGDLVSSTALRLYPKAGGSVQACEGLWPTLLNAVAICDYIVINVPNDCQNSYVEIPEPIYVHAIYLRLLYKQGASILARHHYAKDLVLVSPQQDIYNPMVVQTNDLINASDEDILRAKTYMQERVDQPNRLWYMFEGANSADEQMWDMDDNLIEDMEDGLYAVVFLHSFDDGQFSFGPDGFDDLYHWTIFTINQLIANPNVTKVFVKPHPNTNFIQYIGDGVAFKRLCDLYEGNKKFMWLRKDCSLKAMAKLDKVVGITHHGSVSEELTYLGIPVIASFFGPWGDAFAFVSIWRNPEEYETLLNNLSGKNWTPPSTAMIDDLLSYVVDYRLSVPLIEARTSWMKFGEWINGEVPGNDQATFLYYCRKLEHLCHADALRYLEWLSLAKPNSLKE